MPIWLEMLLSTICHLRLANLILTKVISNHALGASTLVYTSVPIWGVVHWASVL